MNYIDQSFSVRFHYKVYFTTGLFKPYNAIFKNFLAERTVTRTIPKLLFVVDDHVANAHPALLTEIREYFKDSEDVQLLTDILLVPGGEEAKNDKTLFDNIVDHVHIHGIDRHSYIAGIGGGSVLDLVGYAAAVSHRGIKHIRIPTTVLSQNDSGVGVKNGINHGFKKNFLGTFVPPAAVFNDDQFLETLDDRNWRSGIAEAVKVALIKDAPFFEWIENNAPALTSRDRTTMNTLIRRCAELHMEHIASGDPFELGSSRPLDFGHWSAHKLEQLTGFAVLHGEAVAMGMALDTMYSAHAGHLSMDKCTRVIRLLQNLGFAITDAKMQIDSENSPVLLGLEEFREHLGGQLTIMLLQDIGLGIEVHEIDTAILSKAARELNEAAQLT